MIETCSGLCSANKYGLFLDTLTAMSSIIMASAAIGAIDTWRRQRKTEIATQIYEYSLQSANALRHGSQTIKESYDENEDYTYFQQISDYVLSLIPDEGTKTKYALYAKHILKDEEIASVLASATLYLTDINLCLTALTDPSFTGKNQIKRDKNGQPVNPMFLNTEQKLYELEYL